MFTHQKKLFHPVAVERPNPTYANLLQEQMGGAHGELTAGMQYFTQSLRCKDPELKQLFQNIAAEELGHFEMVAETVNLLNGGELDVEKATVGGVQAYTQHGLNPVLANASGVCWTAAYLNVTGDLCADLLSDIAAEQRAKITYEYLYRQIEDKKVRATIDFLLNREEAHNQMFRDAFNKVQETGSNRDYGTTKAARLYFDMTSPKGAHATGEVETQPIAFKGNGKTGRAKPKGQRAQN